MEWLYFRCRRCEVVHRSPVEAPLVTCPNCGGDLVEVEEPANALWASDALINLGSLAPGTPSRPGASGVGHLTGPLGEQMRAVLLEGTPVLGPSPLVTGRDDALAVVMHLTDAQHLAARVFGGYLG